MMSPLYGSRGEQEELYHPPQEQCHILLLRELLSALSGDLHLSWHDVLHTHPIKTLTPVHLALRLKCVQSFVDGPSL